MFAGEYTLEWVKNDDIYYWFSPHKTTWQLAKSECTDLGATLTMVNSAEENDFLLQKL